MPNTKKAARKSTNAQKKAVERHRLNPELFIIRLVDGNPRRKGTFGFKSYEKILKHKRPVQLAKVLDDGARLRDIHWDVTAGNIRLAKKAS